MKLNNFRHPGKTTTRHTATNYIVQVGNDPTEAELETALADAVKAEAVALEAKSRKEE